MLIRGLVLPQLLSSVLQFAILNESIIRIKALDFVLDVDCTS